MGVSAAVSCPARPTTCIMKTRLLIPALLLPAVALLASCKEKGPAEKVGEQIDKSVEKARDAVDPKGPVEKAGEKVDKVLGQ